VSETKQRQKQTPGQGQYKQYPKTMRKTRKAES